MRINLGQMQRHSVVSLKKKICRCFLMRFIFFLAGYEVETQAIHYLANTYRSFSTKVMPPSGAIALSPTPLELTWFR